MELGEKVLYFIPKAKRAKLDKRFGVGVFLGRALWGDENFVARANGTVIRTRGLARMSPKLRWDGRWFDDIKGTPNDMMASDDANIVESGDSPHAQVHTDLDNQAHADAGTEVKASNAMRLTLEMCKQYGFTKNCPRCRYYQHNQPSLRKSNHSTICRARIYKAMREANDDRLRENTKTNANVSTGEHRSDSLPEPRTLPTHDEDQQPDKNEELFLDSVGKDEDDGGMPLDDNGMDGEDSIDDGMNIDVLTNLFMTCGVSSVEATRAAVRVCRIVGTEQPVVMAALHHKEQPSFIEAYGRGSLCDAANRLKPDLNVEGLGALDLRTNRPDGTPWDLSKPSHQHQVLIRFKTWC